MDIIYRLIGSFLFGIFILLFYQKTLAKKSLNLIFQISVSLCFATFMLIAHPYIPEPIRTILGILILGFSLWLRERKILWAALVLSFLCGYFLRITSLLLGTPIILLSQPPDSIAALVFLVMEAVIYCVAYKLIKLKTGWSYIKDFEVKAIIFASAGIILALFGAYHLRLNQVQEYSSLLFFASMIALGFLILGLGAFILHLIKKHKQLRELADERKELIAKNHKYKDIIPTLEALIIQLQKIGGADAYLDALANVATEMSAELEGEHLADEINALKFPNNWKALELYLAQIAKECLTDDFGISLQNNARSESWAGLPISALEFIRLAGNLLSNAKKELHKTNTDLKYITVLFRDKLGFFEFEVHDTAHPFSAEILSKLGQRNNSTNGTGDGFAEVFDLLEKHNASLTITEHVAKTDEYTKRVRVGFDNKSRVVFQTNCRYDELSATLKNTNIEVERLP